MGFLRGLLFILVLALPAKAEDLAGRDAPAFQTVWQSLLTRDEPKDLRLLHELAAQGNTAALIALPLAQRWFPLQPDRAELRRIGAETVYDLGRAAWSPAAAWADGEMSPDPHDQLDRVGLLYDLGETRKADALLNRQLNHGPVALPPADGLAELDVSPMVLARLVLEPLLRGDRRALTHLQALLDHDRIEGWMALSELNEQAELSAGPPIQANLHLAANAGQRLADGKAAWELTWYEEPPPPLPPEVLDMARRDLLPRSTFAPIRAFCAARCGGTATACADTFLSLLGAPHPSITQATPLISLMPEDEFFATPRGAQVLLATALIHRLGLDLDADPATRAAADPAFQAARGMNACLADAALQSLAPLPPSP